MPSYSLDACLKLIGQPIQLISDHQQYEFMENCLRGGMCAASSRLSTTAEGKKFIIDNDPSISDEIADKILEEEKKAEREKGKKYIFDIDMNSKLN